MHTTFLPFAAVSLLAGSFSRLGLGATAEDGPSQVRGTIGWPRSSRPCVPKRSGIGTSSTPSRSQLARPTRRTWSDPGGHVRNDPSRRPSGRPDLLPSEIVHPGASTPSATSEKSRPTTASGPARWSPATASISTSAASSTRTSTPPTRAADPLPAQLPPVGLPERHRGHPCPPQIRPLRCARAARSTSSPKSRPRRGRGAGRRPPLPEGPRWTAGTTRRTCRPFSTSGWPPSGTTSASRSSCPGRSRCSATCRSTRCTSMTLREIAPGVWFPMKITVVDYDREALQQKKQVVGSRTETVVEKVDLGPHHDLAFFRDVAIPAGLPVFTIQDGQLVGSSLPEPIGDEATEKAKLAEVVARSASRRSGTPTSRSRPASTTQSSRLGISHGGIITEQSQAERSVLRGTWRTSRRTGSYATLGGQRSEQNRGTGVRRPVDSRGFTARMQDEPEEQSHRRPCAREAGVRPRAATTASPCCGPIRSCVRDDVDRTGRWPTCSSRPGTTRSTSTACGSAIAARRSSTATPASSSAATSTTRGPAARQLHGLLACHRPELHPDQDGALRRQLRLPAHAHGHQPLRRLPRDRPGGLVSVPLTQLSFDNWMHMAQGRITLNWRRDYESSRRRCPPGGRGPVPRRRSCPRGRRSRSATRTATTSASSSSPRRASPRSRLPVI